MNGIYILIVDDEDVVLESCERALRVQGYSVTCTHSVDGALSELKKRRFDVVIVDLVMPKRGGMELLKIITTDYPQIEVIMITGYSSINTAVESIKLGAHDYLAKPFSPSELVITVKSALEKKGRAFYPFVTDKELPAEMIFDNIIGRNSRMVEVFKLVSKVAATDTTVLVTGESGTGKELVAKAIHRNSKRQDHNFVVVDCLSLSPTLLESELFGHIKGSFTGAVSNKAGFFEVADKGTLFLDEIGDLGLELQGKLLRVIQERRYVPVGGTEPKETDIRLVAATNKNLKKMVLTGSFREDLFYRLYVVPIFMPPLRERKEDISLLVDFFMKKFTGKHGCPVKRISPEVMDIFMSYDWPGNVRELENTIERAIISSEGTDILTGDLPDSMQNGVKETQSNPIAQGPKNIAELKNIAKQLRQKAVEEVEKNFILRALATNDWKVSHAAESVGIQRTNFYRLMKKYNIGLPKGVAEEKEP